MGSKGGMQPMTNSGGPSNGMSYGGKFGNYPSPTQELNPRNPYSGYSPASASMPMAYGPTGTQNQNQNPYQYRLYGSDSVLPGYDQFAQQPFQSNSNFGTVGPQTGKGFSGSSDGQPFDREAAYNQLMSSPLGQKFGFAMDTYRGIMNPALGMQSYGVGPYAEGATDYQGMAQEASGVGQNAGGGAVAAARERQIPDFLIPMSEYFQEGNRPYVNPAMMTTLGGAMQSATIGKPNVFGGRSSSFGMGGDNVIHSLDRQTNSPLPGAPIEYRQMTAEQRRNYLADQGYLYDPTSGQVYSREAALARFGY